MIMRLEEEDEEEEEQKISLLLATKKKKRRRREDCKENDHVSFWSLSLLLSNLGVVVKAANWSYTWCCRCNLTVTTTPLISLGLLEKPGPGQYC
jgi:hypothetical protein